MTQVRVTRILRSGALVKQVGGETQENLPKFKNLAFAENIQCTEKGAL